MKPFLLVVVFTCCNILLSGCSKRMEGDRRTNGFEQKLLGKWNLAGRPNAGYWLFKGDVIDSLSTRNKTVRELEIHIPGFCQGKGYWSLTNDSILDNSCIPMARLTKITNDSLIFKFIGGLVEFEYKWKR